MKKVVIALLLLTGAGATTHAQSRQVVNMPTVTTIVPTNGTACSTVGGSSCSNIYGGSGGTNLSTYSSVTITIRNSGANTLDNVLLEWSPDGTNWEIWDSTTFAALATVTTLSMAITGNSRKFLRIEARAATVTTTVVSITGAN